MRRCLALAAIVSAGCYAGADPAGRGDGGNGPVADTETGTDGGADTGDVDPGGSEDTGDAPPPADPPPDGLTDEEVSCDYTLVHEALGMVLEVSEDTPELEVTPLQPGEGFYCLKVEFDLHTVDSFDSMATEHDGCPTHAAIASAYGTGTLGEYMATAFFRAYDDVEGTCMRGADRIEVGNFRDYSGDTEGPWTPGETYHVVVEVKPFLSRISLSQDGAAVGPRISANLYPAAVANTRDPVVRLGQNRVTAGTFFPWYGAAYENLKIWAAVAPAEGG